MTAIIKVRLFILIYFEIQTADGIKIKMSNIPNFIDIRKRMFQIKKNQKKAPIIDFSLKLDAYHTNDNCLHCKKGALNHYIFNNLELQPQ